MHTPFLGGLWDHPPENRTDSTAQQAKSAVEQLEARMDRALLTMEAIWTIVRDRVGVTEEELADRIVDLDLTDGLLEHANRKLKGLSRVVGILEVLQTAKVRLVGLEALRGSRRDNPLLLR